MNTDSPRDVVCTIGHSNLEIHEFVRLLTREGIELVADVRTSPYSRYVPQFNRDVLAEVLPQHGIRYTFVGDVLGGRPADPCCLDRAGNPNYEEMARNVSFLEGVEKIAAQARECCVCLLCSEEDPSQCHRGLLIGRVLAERGVAVLHIRKDGTTESQDEMKLRMARGQLTLF